MKALKQILFSFGLAGYVFLALFGLVAMGSVHQHPMSGMDNCPFMLGEQALCTMDLTEHIGMWESLTKTTLITLLVVAIPFLFVLFSLSLRPPNLARIKLRQKLYREKFITSLFSQGILHPKVP